MRPTIGTRVRATIARVRDMFSRSKTVAEQNEEFDFHREMEIEHNRRRGMSDSEARRQAAIDFGGQLRYAEATSDARGFESLEHLRRDAVHAFRRIRRSPGFAASAIATLGIGIGAATGIGAIVYGVLLRDLPYPNASSLVRVSYLTPAIASSGELHSAATYTHVAAVARSFDAIGAYYTNDAINLTDGDDPERVTAGMVTPGTFRMLQVVPMLGRLFTDADTAFTSDDPVLIGQDLWERRYGADPNIIGKQIAINLGKRRVGGVLPRSFDFPSQDVQLWYPISPDLHEGPPTERYYSVVARLRAGASPASAQAEVNVLLASLGDHVPAFDHATLEQSGAHLTVQSLKSAIVAPLRGQLVLLGMLVVVVLLIATTNIVSLFLLRIERAAVEIAIAQSLGASRAALARRFVVEGLIIGAASTIVAIPVAATALATKLGFGAHEIPRLHEITFGPSTIAVIVLLALAIGAIIGATPLVRTDVGRLADRLRGARETSSRAWRHAQQALVAAQIALAFALVVAAALLGRSFWNLRNAKLGFDPAGLTTFDLSLPFRGYAAYGDAAAFYARVIDGLRALPGVTGADAVVELPLVSGGWPELALRLQAEDAPNQAVVPVMTNMATTDYFHDMSIPLRGRSFMAGDLRTPMPAIVISENVARALFGTENPIGRRVRRIGAPTARATEFQIVGIAGNVRGERIEDGPVSVAYFPLLRDADGVPRDSTRAPIIPRAARIIVRASSPLSAASIRALVREIDRRVPVVNLRPMSALVDAATTRVRLTMLLLGVAGGAALILGMVGVYSVVSYAAAGRLREFAVRLALGATPSGLRSTILREGIVLGMAGVGSGLAIAALGTRFFRTLLFDVSPVSVPEFVGASVLLVSITLLATYIPARRASRTDPALVLRGE